MPTIWEHGPYRFFIYSADRDKPPMFMWNVKKTKQNFGLTQYDCRTAAVTVEMKSTVFKG